MKVTVREIYTEDEESFELLGEEGCAISIDDKLHIDYITTDNLNIVVTVDAPFKIRGADGYTMIMKKR